MLFRGVRPRVLAAAAAVATSVLVTVCSSCAGDPAGGQRAPSDSATGSVITSTTLIAGAGVLGNQRRPDESCASDPAKLDPGPPTRRVRNTPGVAAEEVEVPADPQRIVVFSGDQLDALCALGLQSRIVAGAMPDGSTSQPAYLGTTIHDLPGVGTRSDPDLAGIAAADPDLILGSAALTPEDYPQLAAIAPTVFTAAPGAVWEDNLRTVGAATGRRRAADALVDKFTARAAQTGAGNDAAHFQASVVQFTDKTMRIYGADNFPASVLAAVGVDRPASQAFADQPYVEVGTTDLPHADFSAADADIVYVSFASRAARERGPRVLNSGAWRALSANQDNRVFVVNNEVWQTGQGLVAARGILNDLKWLNAPIN